MKDHSALCRRFCVFAMMTVSAVAGGGAAATTDSQSEDIDATEGVRSGYDISGDWLWSESNIIMIPGHVSELIGIEQEGPTLHLK